VNEHSLKLHFCIFENHKGNIIVWIVKTNLDYFILIAKFKYSKLDTNQKCFYMFKTFKCQVRTILFFFKCFFIFYQMCTIISKN
jgi:hypothetical protein